MSRGGRARGRRSRRPPAGGLLYWALSLPARLHLRWLVIAVVTAAVMGAYARVLVTAAPMPPSKAPATSAAGGDGSGSDGPRATEAPRKSDPGQ
ncbi:hypothetical protein [Streptomyces malaysiense]|uniref:hypothetical protein n=1 Tax=Streptomyces malaysiense TaxID=1428626 RepID=UPI000AF1ED1D|nr:hypothetical protein [Streptomyces malaysiense]